MPGDPGWREYLPRARWYAGKAGGDLTGVRPLDWYTAPGSLPAVRSELATVTAGGEVDTYHLLVGYLAAGTAEPDARVGTTRLPGVGEVDVVDAPASPIAMQALLAALVGTPPAGMRWLKRPAAAPAQIRVSTAEQSNSTVFAGDSLVKVYRRLEPGANPDPEVLAALGGRQVPELYGVLSADGYDLALVCELLPDARDGWEHATAACAAGRPVDDELRQLGVVLRDLHAALADAFGTGATSLSGLRGRFLADLDEAIAAVPDLAGDSAALASVLTVASDGDLATQRVHGDFHLGQALLTPSGWRVIDFEGEPGVPIAERRAMDSPWRDVAGLLRSLDYARSAHADPDGPDARDWALAARAAFLAGYGRRDSDPALLRAYEADRMLYEVGYEMRNRPDWVRIPLSAVKDVARSDLRRSNGV